MDLAYQIIFGIYGGLILLSVSLLVRILLKINERQKEHKIRLDNQAVIVKNIDGKNIPTIRIQIENLEHKTDDIEQRTLKLEEDAKSHI